VGDAEDPQAFWSLFLRHLEWLRVRHYSPRTVRLREFHLGHFLEWCEPRGLARPGDVTRPLLERYQRALYVYRKKDGKPLAFVSQSQRIQAVQGFFSWLARQNVIASNPAADLELPRTEKRLPRVILSASEVEAVLAVPDVTEPMGLRDRAMLETLYSTGVRRMELVGLELDDIDVDRGTVFVRQGKGKKDRVIPIGERALAWIDKYLREARPVLMRDAADSAAKGLFVSYFGEPLAPDHVSQRVKQCVEAAELGKRGACHIFRHSMATQMLENGADIRFVQEMLGHAMLNTTQIYTQVSIRKLQEIHAATHPGARLKPRTSAESEAGELPPFAAEAADDDDVSR